MQAWLLHIIYGAFMSGASQYNVAKQMLRTGVDVRTTMPIVFVNYSGSSCHQKLY